MFIFQRTLLAFKMTSQMIDLGKVFIKSVYDGNLEKVKACVTLGVDINYMDHQGKNALMYAIITDEVDRRHILDLLVHQPNIDVKVKAWRKSIIPFLHFIAEMTKLNSNFMELEYGIDYIFRKLFAAPGVNLNAKERGFYGQTLIHYCLTHIKLPNKIDVFKLFTQYPGFNWNIPDNNGTMPIHLATEMAIKGDERDVEILKILLNVPTIDVNAKDSNNENIANYVVDEWYCSICSEENYANDGCDECSQGVGRRAEEGLPVIKLLSQDERINWNNKNCLGNTPLVQAVEYGNVEAVKILLTIPCVDVTVLENMPLTPVMLKCIQHLRDATTISLSIPECPVCYEPFQSGQPIYQCDTGHFVCGSCYERGNSCPVCRGNMMGRCTDFEKFLENNANNI